jgi:hypothetical protein
LDPLVDAEGIFVDFDNDGDLDLLYAGEDRGFPPAVLRFYLNTGGGQFLKIPAPETGAAWPLAFGDYDGDGDLDIHATGYLHRNNSQAINLLPNAPSDLSATVTEGAVLLRWGPATDANQAGGLTYNLRVGTTSGGTQVVSPMANPTTGRRHVVAPGNAWQAERWQLRNLAPGTYYWSVQAVDNALAGGPFAPEARFTIGGGELPTFIGIREGAPGSFVVTVSVPAAGVFSLEWSTDLVHWDMSSAHDLPAGRSDLTIDRGPEAAAFFRLKGD